MKQKWFFGLISVDGAEKVLQNKLVEPNSFLVRLNAGGNTAIETTPFTISRKDKDGAVLHTRVYPSRNGGFYVKIDGVTTKCPGNPFSLKIISRKFDTF